MTQGKRIAIDNPFFHQFFGRKKTQAAQKFDILWKHSLQGKLRGLIGPDLHRLHACLIARGILFSPHGVCENDFAVSVVECFHDVCVVCAFAGYEGQTVDDCGIFLVGDCVV